MFRVHTPIIRSSRCWVAAYGFLHQVFGWVVVLRAAAWVVCGADGASLLHSSSAPPDSTFLCVRHSVKSLRPPPLPSKCRALFDRDVLLYNLVRFNVMLIINGCLYFLRCHVPVHRPLSSNIWTRTNDWQTIKRYFDILLTVHLNIFIS